MDGDGDGDDSSEGSIIMGPQWTAGLDASPANSDGDESTIVMGPQVPGMSRRPSSCRSRKSTPQVPGSPQLTE